MKTQTIETPTHEHAVMAMLVAIHMVPEGRERAAMIEAMQVFAFRGWQWNSMKLQEELDACYKAARFENPAQLICSFGPDGFEVEFKLPK